VSYDWALPLAQMAKTSQVGQCPCPAVAIGKGGGGGRELRRAVWACCGREASGQRRRGKARRPRSPAGRREVPPDLPFRVGEHVQVPHAVGREAPACHRGMPSRNTWQPEYRWLST